MPHDLTLIHRPKPAVFPQVTGPVWTTCLRSVAIVDEPDPTTTIPMYEGDTIHRGASAYGFLLEVICGLRSPIVGETEVFGQFKQFSQQWTLASPRHAKIVQRLMSDAKFIRTKYLSHLGAQSYGSWVRKNIKSNPVHIVGGGLLAREIIPYLIKLQYEIVVHVREPQKVKFFTGRREQYSPCGFNGGSVIIAAPVTNDSLQNWMGERVPRQLFDLRDTSQTDRLPLTGNTETFLLQDIFTEIENSKARLAPRLFEAQREIHTRTEKAIGHSLVRPNGWDDLCA